MLLLTPIGILLVVTVLSGLSVFGVNTNIRPIDRLARFFISLKWTVILLGLGLVLVFWGTLAQVNLGLYKAQNEFFRSYIIFWTPKGWATVIPFLPGIPVFPGGYMIGGLLLINLFSAHLRYYQPGRKKWGIVLIHLGVVLLLLGQLLTDLLSTESMMHIRQGAAKNYSESTTDYELAFIDSTDPESDRVVTIPSSQLQKRRDITSPDLPFGVRAITYYGNSSVIEKPAIEKPATGYTQVSVTEGIGARTDGGIWWRELPHVTAMNERDTPSATVELWTPEGSLGTYLVSGFLSRKTESGTYDWVPQKLNFKGRVYQFGLRLKRFYKPFSLHLVEFKFDRYPGTEIPKNFSSRVRLQRPDTGEDREVLIYMNNPLRYAGETFYQADWDKSDEKGTVLQVVRNPSWLTPYFACVMVAVGMILQFTTHLVRFASRRKNA